MLDQHLLVCSTLLGKVTDPDLMHYMLQLGFDSLFFARIDYQDRAKRRDEKSLEVIWQGSRSLGASSQVNYLKGHPIS